MRRTDRDRLRPRLWFTLPGETVKDDQLRDQCRHGQSVEQRERDHAGHNDDDRGRLQDHERRRQRGCQSDQAEHQSTLQAHAFERGAQDRFDHSEYTKAKRRLRHR
jgi:hypothetical protein